jgi:hypothetical protein
MTVRELIAALERKPQDAVVIVDMHSEYGEANPPEHIVGFENGGYVSRAYRAEDWAKGRDYVLISYRSWEETR